MINSNDRFMSIIGGGNGVSSALSRLVIGALLDRYAYKRVVPFFYGLLALCLILIYYVANLYFVGFILLMWIIHLLTFIHFTSIPTQTIKLYDARYNSIVLGTIGMSDSFAYTAVAVLNYSMFSLSQENFFFYYNLSLFCFTCLAAVSSAFVNEKPLQIHQQSDEAIVSEKTLQISQPKDETFVSEKPKLNELHQRQLPQANDETFVSKKPLRLPQPNNKKS